MAATSSYDVGALTLALQAISDKLTVPEANYSQHLLSLKRELTRTLDFLQTAADETTSNSNALDGPPPILEGFEAWIESLADTIDLAAPTDPSTSSTAMWYLRTLQNRSRWTKSPSGFLIYLSLLPAKQSKAFEWDPGHAPIDLWRAHVVGLVSETMVDDMSYYLDILNSELNNREPDEFHKETLWAEMRNSMVPDYQVAATEWPKHANQHWAALRPKIFTLFNSANTYNFLQWALEWIQITGLSSVGVDTKKPDAKGAQAVINLTKDLCSGSLSPLHMAALLGLPHLCEDLVSAGMDPNRTWKGRTPLHCALEGNAACFGLYVSGTSPHSSSDPYCYKERRKDVINREQRAETIRCLLEHTDLIDAEEGPGAIPIAPLAFLIAQMINSPEIFELIVDQGAELDDGLNKALVDDILCPKTKEDEECLSRMLTHLHGTFIVNREDCEELGNLIEERMAYHGIDFYLEDGSCPLLKETPACLRGLAAESILSGSAFDLRHICLQRTFNPNPVEGEFKSEREGLLHLAVGGGNLEMIDLLMTKGADLEALDEEGRTPLMNAETPGVIEKLVLQYGASTESQDKKGRTIWHSAAYIDDVPVLTWLMHYDPHKENNFIKKSVEGCTPLAEAMMAITRPAHDGRRRAEDPKASRYLLSHAVGQGDQCLASPIPLTHLVAAWGDVGMVEVLSACEVNWQQLDAEGLSALHYLTLSAVPPFAKWIQLLVTREVYLKSRVHVVEAFFINIASTPIHSRRTNTTFLPAILNSLHLSSLAKSKDDRGCFWWQSFCSRVLPEALRTAENGTSMPYPLLGAALKCFLDAGALGAFEEAQGKSGVLCMFDKSKKASWDKSTIEGEWLRLSRAGTQHLIVQILRNSNPVLFKQFCQTPEAVLFMLSEIQLDDGNGGHGSPLVKTLCQGGLRVFSTQYDHLKLETPLEMALKTRYSFCAVLSEFSLEENVTAQEVTEGMRRIMKALVSSMHSNMSDDTETTKLQMLLAKGMIVGGIRNDADFSNVLHEAITLRRYRFAMLLIDNGVDPSQPCEACKLPSSVHCAIRVSAFPMLDFLIKKLPPNFPWGSDRDAAGGQKFAKSAAAFCVENGFSEGFALIMNRTSAGQCGKDVIFHQQCLARLNFGKQRALASILETLDHHGPEVFMQVLRRNSNANLLIAVNVLLFTTENERDRRKSRQPLIKFMRKHLDFFQSVLDGVPREELLKYMATDETAVADLVKAGFDLPEIGG